jgi:hypothetical protein
MIDRRTGGDRRKFPRYTVSVEIEWENAKGRKKGTVSDISLQGCFVLCSGEVENGETVKLFLPISDGMKGQFIGEVVNHFYEIGFGVKFIELGEAQKNFLEQYLKMLKK